MSLLSDLRVLYHLACRPISGGSHKDRLESFYKGQAGDYDSFRKRLLKGREALYRRMPIPGDGSGVWLDMGGGTGTNIEAISHLLPKLRKVYIVDLSSSLLEVARQRIDKNGWKNVEAVEADVTTFVPPEGVADVVTFSYSLTMIPDWFLAIDQAQRLLGPTGHIGVVDFFVSRKYPAKGYPKHGWPTRSFWPIWFAMDNVFPNPDHVPYLAANFDRVAFKGNRGAVPYMMGLQMPYYQFIGRNKEKI